VSSSLQPAPVLLTGTEAVFLASMLGAGTLLATQDPLAGLLAEEIAGEWERSRAGLKARGYLLEGANGSVTIDSEVAGLVGAWAAPESVIMASYKSGSGQVGARDYFLTERMAVRRTDAPEGYFLEAVSAEGIHSDVEELFGLAGQPAAPGAQVVLPEVLFNEARQVAAERGTEATYTLLSEAFYSQGVSLAAISALSASLAGPHASGSVTAMSRQTTTWEVSGLGLLEGPQGVWRLRSFSRDSRNWVEAIPCDASTMGAEIKKTVNRVLPDHEY
jgi:hypothetical protein